MTGTNVAVNVAKRGVVETNADNRCIEIDATLIMNNIAKTNEENNLSVSTKTSEENLSTDTILQILNEICDNVIEQEQKQLEKQVRNEITSTSRLVNGFSFDHDLDKEMRIQTSLTLSRNFQRSYSCDYDSLLSDDIDLNVILRDSDGWRQPGEVNCFLKECNCNLKTLNNSKLSETSPKSRKISFVHFEDELCIQTDIEQVSLLANDNPSNECKDNETNKIVPRTRRDSLYSLKEEDLDENENTVQLRETVIHLYVKEQQQEDENEVQVNQEKYSTSSQESIIEAVNETLTEQLSDVLEEDEIAKENQNRHEQHHKKNFFKSLFSRSSTPKTLKLEKSTSVTDVSSIKRSSSFLKKTLSKQTLLESATKLKRSLSIRKLSDKREQREKVSDLKSREWAASLQSLVETDTGVSYNDLSFINYDRYDDSYNYDKYLSQWSRRNQNKRFDCGNASDGSKCIYRTQSMIVNKGQTPHFVRHKSVSSFANYSSSRRNLRLSNCTKKYLTSITNRNEQDDYPLENRNGSDDDDNESYAKSLPCLINNNPIKTSVGKVRPLSAISFKQHEQNSLRQGVDQEHEHEGLSEQDNNCNEIDGSTNLNENENSWRSRNGSITQRKISNNRTTKLKRQNACRQKSNPLIVDGDGNGGNSKNPCRRVHESFQFPHQQHLHHSDLSESLRLQSQLHECQQLQSCVTLRRSDRNLHDCEANDNRFSENLLNQSEFVHNESKSLDFVAENIDEDSTRENATVRSRSLNHLDSLEMRQGNVPVAGTTVSPSCTPGGLENVEPLLKDAKSEPNCTSRPLLAPPEQQLVKNVSPPSSSTCPSPTYKRHMLSRSQKSSSECFSVNFEVGDEATYDTELFFPASRGVTLHESLSKLCELRNIDLSSCDIWLCDRESNVQSWLSLSQDTACLVGKHVKITAKDGRTKTIQQQTQQQPQLQLKESQPSLQTQSHLMSSSSHSRKLSGNFRPRTTSFFSSSTEEPSTADFDSSKKQSKQRWSTNLFGNSKDSKQSMEQLIEHLNHYSRYGVPRTQSYTLSRSDSQEALNKLEDDWREIVDTGELNDKQQKQQTALWELIKTEVAYIKTLKVVTDLFLACLINLQASNILRDIDTNKLFSNITDILDANVQFWRKYLFPLVKDMRSYGKPACLESMCEGFLKLKDCFQAYYRFCGEQSRCQHYCRDNLTHNELFTAYLAWCETQKECNRLRLMDILVQPMQRLTKYGLLLKAILRNSDDEVDRDNLNIMIRSVDDFVNNVNFSLKQKQDNERLKGIIARIESYDIVETKDDDLEKLVRNYNQLDLTKPMLNCCPERRRHLLLEGDLKLKDSNTSKMEVHCFLLTDMLLVCKQSTKKGGATMRVIRQPYLIDKLVATEINKETPTLACVYKNELDMAIGAFLLQNSDSKKLKTWKDGITKAQTLYAQAKQTYLPAEESLDTEYSFEYAMENEFHCLQAPRSPLASSSRASRVSSLAHSHSGSVEMNDQSSLGSCKAVSVENDNRTASISSDEGVQSLPADQKSPSGGGGGGGGSMKNSFKMHRIFAKTPNTLSVQPTYSHHLGQSMPNLALGSPNTLNSNTLLSVPSTSKNGHLLSPTHRGISYPPPSPTRGNLRRGMAITQSKNPPLIKTRHVSSSVSTAGSADFVPVIAGVSSEDTGEFGDFSRGHHRQAMKRTHRSDNRRYHTAGTVDDIKKEDNKEQMASTSGIQKRSSWNCSSSQTTQSQSNNAKSNEEDT